MNIDVLGSQRAVHTSLGHRTFYEQGVHLIATQRSHVTAQPDMHRET